MTEILLILFVLAAVGGPWVVVLVIGLWRTASRTVDRPTSFDEAADDALDLFDDDDDEAALQELDEEETEEEVEHFVLWENELRESAK